MEISAAISNDFQAFQLWNLAAQGARPGHESAPRGPYMVVQEGCAPTDPASRLCSFVLTRHGTWLHGFVFFMLPEGVRRRLGVFDSVQEVVSLSEGLVGNPTVETGATFRAWLAAEALELANPEPLELLDRVHRPVVE